MALMEPQPQPPAQAEAGTGRAPGQKRAFSLFPRYFIGNFQNDVDDFRVGVALVFHIAPAAFHFGLGGTSGKTLRQPPQGFGRPQALIQVVADGDIFRSRAESPQGLRPMVSVRTSWDMPAPVRKSETDWPRPCRVCPDAKAHGGRLRSGRSVASGFQCSFPCRNRE